MKPFIVQLGSLILTVTFLFSGCAKELPPSVSSQPASAPEISSKEPPSSAYVLSEQVQDSPFSGSNLNKVDESLMKMRNKSLEVLTSEDIALLFTQPRATVENSCNLKPVTYFAEEEYRLPQGESPVKGLDMVYDYCAEQYFKEQYDNLTPYYLISTEEVFGVKPGEPLEKFKETFGAIDIRKSGLWSDEKYSYFFILNRGSVSYMFCSTEMENPTYNELRISYRNMPSCTDREDAYLGLIGKEPAELTPKDLKRLLTTPVEKLEELYSIPLLEIPTDKDSVDYELFRLYDNVQPLPIHSTTMKYQGGDRTLPPAVLNIGSRYDKVCGIQLGTSFADIEKIWGAAPRRLYSNAMGYWGKMWQATEYYRDGLVYSFRCETPIMIENYGFTDQGFDESELPWQKFPQLVTRVVISLDDGNEHFYNML